MTPGMKGGGGSTSSCDPRQVRGRHAAAWFALLLCGCLAVPPANRPIDVWVDEPEAHASGLLSAERSGEVLFVLTLSGGGTRAAALAFGALQELAATRVTLAERERSLLDEVDLVSSVSGGSFAAAYLGLRGERILDEFEDVFLRRNVQRALILEVLRPVNWLRLLRIDRSQLAAAYYDRTIFDGATFSDMHRVEGPEVILNATDLSTAGRFPFSRLWFGAICSDLGRFPVSQAVTASSAVPVVFPSIRLRNYAGRCGFAMPDAFGEAEGMPGVVADVVREELRRVYADSEILAYIHLLDGGLSDNLGLRNAVAAIVTVGDARRAMRRIGHENVRLILVVTVNAETAAKRTWARANRAASAVQVVNGLSTAQIHNQNKLTIALAREAFGSWAQDLSRPGAPVAFEFAEVSFQAVEDPVERAYLDGIETSFNLSDEKVDRLIAAGRQVLRDSPAYGRALDVLGGD